MAGVPGEKLVEAHGAFYTAHCLQCRKMYTQDWIKSEYINIVYYTYETIALFK